MKSTLIQDLVDVGSGKLAHLHLGRCPDAIEGWDMRDRVCPACKVLIAGEQELLSAARSNACVAQKLD